MTRNDVIKIMSVLRGAYPGFYRGISKAEALDTINLWADMFANDDAALVGVAVKCLIETDEKGFPPTIGQVKAKMRMLASKTAPTESEAWNLVAAAVKNGLYGAAEEFAKLPDVCQRIVGSPSQLRDWAMMDSNSLHSVVASNFQRSYRVISERKKEIAKLPEDVRACLGLTAVECGEKKAIPENLPTRGRKTAYEREKETLARLEAQREEQRDRLAAEDQESRKRRDEIIAALKGGG